MAQRISKGWGLVANSLNKKSQNLPRCASKTDKKCTNVIKSSGTVLLFKKKIHVTTNGCTCPLHFV